MSAVVGTKTYVFHTDLGPVVTQINTIAKYDVEDVIHNRAMSQASRVQFINLGRKVGANGPKATRTIASTFTSVNERLTN